MTLDEAIAQQIELGEKDALTIARKVEKLYGADWLANEMLSLAEDVICERARQRLNAQLRAAVVAIRPGRAIDRAEIGLKTLWVPNAIAKGVGARKPLHDCTPADFDSAARLRESMARANLVQAGWLRETADRMRAAGAETFSDYRGELPELPSGEELEAA